MNCIFKKEKAMGESLLKNIELSPFNSNDCDTDLKKTDNNIFKYKEQLPWQFFLETHSHKDDIGWWIKR